MYKVPLALGSGALTGMRRVRPAHGPQAGLPACIRLCAREAAATQHFTWNLRHPELALRTVPCASTTTLRLAKGAVPACDHEKIQTLSREFGSSLSNRASPCKGRLPGVFGLQAFGRVRERADAPGAPAPPGAGRRSLRGPGQLGVLRGRAQAGGRAPRPRSRAVPLSTHECARAHSPAIERRHGRRCVQR